MMMMTCSCFLPSFRFVARPLSCEKKCQLKTRTRVKMGFVNKFQCDDKLKQLSILFLLVKQGESINQSINQSMN